MLSVAVIGSGPSGYYVTEGLLNELGAAIQIDVLDRLPTPYGLVRSGVAPDHQSLKAVIRRFERLHASQAVQFFGNLQLGEDLGLAELREMYDAVVLAVGASEGRTLGVPGESLPGVYSSTQMVGWYNAHPDFAAFSPCLDAATAVVIGNGNVAIDIARVLTKTPREMAHSDLARGAAAAIHASRLREVHIVGRRGPLHVSFTPKELGELGELSATIATADAAQMPAATAPHVGDPAFQRVIETLRGFAARGSMENSAAGKPKRIHFEFFARPVEILGDTRVRAVRFERTVLRGDTVIGTSEHFDVPCGVVVSCIGYRCKPLAGVPFDEERGIFRNTDGLIEPGLYCVGWARRGPTGTIGTNRPDGFSVATRIAATPSPCGKPGRAGLQSLIAARKLRAVSFAEWKLIDAAEATAAPPGAPREKVISIARMLHIAHAER